MRLPGTRDDERRGPEDAAETARAVIAAAAVGLNLEDAADPEPPGRAAPSGRGSGPSPLLELGAQLEKVRAVVEAGRGPGCRWL